jgi:hypothetical protein
MRRTSRLALFAVAVGLVVPTAVSSTTASAVDQDLVLSTAAGPAGTEVTATSASCDPVETDDYVRAITVRLIAGAGSDQVLAGVAVGYGDQDATIVVPDWVSPDEPATIEATCLEIDFGSGGSETTFTFDPVAFDVEASVDPGVQARTYSRTSLQAGQAFAVEGSGCFLDNADNASVEVAQGSDLTFRSLTDYVAYSGSDLDGDSFDVATALSNGGLGLDGSQTGDETPVLEAVEMPTDIPAGTYSTISYCSTQDGLNLVYEPQLIEVTGNAPFDDVDLTVPADSRTATLAGGSCTTGDVNLQLYATDSQDLFNDLPPDATLADTARRSPVKTASGVGRTGASGTVTRTNDAWARARGGSASAGRALTDDEYLEAIVTPGADGSWAASDTVAFDNGFVEGYSWCGDPLGDGFLYDPQGAIVDVTPQETTTTTTTTTAPAPSPAPAIKGTPTYAG